MTLADFMKLVGEMRAAQKAYFKNRGYDAQSAAMKLERDVDKAMADHDGGQAKLFGWDSEDENTNRPSRRRSREDQSGDIPDRSAVRDGHFGRTRLGCLP